MDLWIWDGGRVSLDFVNTLRHRWRTHPEETLGGPVDLARWLSARTGFPLTLPRQLQ